MAGAFSTNRQQPAQRVQQTKERFVPRGTPPAQRFKNTIVKPSFDHGGGGFVFDNRYAGQQFEVRDANGNIVDTGGIANRPGEHGVKTPSSYVQSGQFGPGHTISVNGQQVYNVGDVGRPGARYDLGSGGQVTASNKGAAGQGGGALGGATGGSSTNGVANPFDLSSQYPIFQPISPNPISFGQIEKAPYNFTNAIEFGQKFGAANAENFKTNFNQSQQYGLQTLDTELKGLQGFAPAAAALKREQTSVDNTFNQGQRTDQINQALPGAEGVFNRAEQTLNAQADRAATYAQGQLTNPQLDRALELGIRSGSADTASFGGFGARSQQASKISDLQSAEARFQIAQYGEGLTSNNVQAQQTTQANRANLFLAPTQYSDAGGQIRTTPEVGAGRAASQTLGQLNESTLISPGQALTSTIQQNQFQTQNENRVREFNTTGVFQADQFNSNQKFTADTYNSQGQFAADLGLFNYQVGYAGQVQGANQAGLNNQLQAQVGQANSGTYNQGLQQGQNAQAIQNTIQAVGGTTGAGGGIASTLTSGGSAGDSGGGSSKPVGGGSSVDTSPSQSSTTQGSSQGDKQLQNASTTSSIPDGGGAISRPIGADNSVAGGYKFDGNAPVPSGYSQVSSNPDGSVTAVRNSDSAQDLQRFGQFGGNPANSTLAAGAIASADRAFANSAGLSFQPVSGFQPIGLTANGGSVSSSPGMATNGDGTLGGQSVSNLGKYMGAIGSADTATATALGDVAAFSGDQNVHAALDDINATGGKDAVTQQILNTLGKGIDPNSKAGAQVVAGAMRIGEQWGNLSPAQKSLALSSLADPIVEAKTGVAIGDKPVQGTERTAHGALKTREVTQMLNQNMNGLSFANNWDQVSSIGQMIGGSQNNVQAAGVAQSLGMGGYGPQGASVDISEGQLSKVGAESASQYGIGAATFPSVKTVPNGYDIVTQTPDGKVVALPKTHASTSPFTKGSISPLVFKKTQEISQGTHRAQRSWQNNAPNKGLSKGAAGGSAIISSLENMQKQVPHLYNAVAARSLFLATMGDD